MTTNKNDEEIKENPNDSENQEDRNEKEEGKVFSYLPFEENDVLTVGCTMSTVILLLRNGTLCSWGDKGNTLGRGISEALNDCYIPVQIKPRVTFVDLACGREHCIARSDNYRVFSWGSNANGQLGLMNFPTNFNSVKEEPSEIETFNKVKIKQIFAAGNTSLSITEGGNNIYGWGANENGQLGINPNNDFIQNGLLTNYKKVVIPTKLDISEKFSGEITIFQDKKGLKTYIAEMQRPSSNLVQALEIFKNKHLFSREVELKEEILKLELQEYQYKKRKALASETSLKNWQNDDFIKDIDSLIEKFREKSKALAMKSAAFDYEKNTETINSYDKQIDFFNNKDKDIQKSKREHDLKENQLKNENIRAKLQESNLENIDGLTKTMNEKKAKIIQEKQKTVEISELIQRVASEVKIQKHITLNEVLKKKEELKKKNEKKKKIDEYIKAFEEVKEKRKLIINKHNENRTIIDTESIIKKLKADIEIFEENLLKFCDKMPKNSKNSEELLQHSIDTSNKNLGKLEFKLKGLFETVDPQNDTGKKILMIFQKNILAAKQNNFLLEKIIDYSKLFYQTALEKVIRNDNPSNFNDIKDKIDKIKKSISEPEEEIEKEDDEDNEIKTSSVK